MMKVRATGAYGLLPTPDTRSTLVQERAHTNLTYCTETAWDPNPWLAAVLVCAALATFALLAMSASTSAHHPSSVDEYPM